MPIELDFHEDLKGIKMDNEDFNRGQRIYINPIDDACNMDEESLEILKQSGKRLKELLNITEADIDRAIKDLRRNW